MRVAAPRRNRTGGLALGRAAPHPSRNACPNRRTAAGSFPSMVRRARLVAARASARTARQGPRRPLGAADRPHRRRQDAGGFFLPTLVELSAISGSARAVCHILAAALPPSLREAAGRGRGWGVSPRIHRQRVCGSAPHPRPRERASPRLGPRHALSRAGGGEKKASRSAPTIISTGRGVQHSRGLHTLYISPLKALAVDIARNLETPVREMGLPIRIETRHRRHAGVAAAAAAALSAGYPADHAGTTGAAVVVPTTRRFCSLAPAHRARRAARRW